METVVCLIILIASSLFLAAVLFGKQPKLSNEEIVWEKLDEHEQALGE